MKITFLGDIMIEPPVLKAAHKPDGGYDFYPVFERAQALLDEADMVVANLETPLAGAEAEYTKHHYAFNAPDAYADAVKKAGIDMVSTANNHTFDRGYAGMERTIRILNEKGIGHHGSFLPGTERPEAFYMDVQGVKVAVIAYTYGTNYGGSGQKCLAAGEYAGTVNLLRPQTETVYQVGVFRKDWVDKVFSFVLAEPRGWIKKFFGMPTNFPRADDRLNKKTMAPYVEQFQADIRKAKEKADIVIFYPHTGGQFNPHPGAITEYVMDKALEAGADAIMASHSHMVQNADMRGNVPCVYSLGNFNMSPRSSLMLHEYLPDYGLAVHMYVDDKKISRVTFSILKAVETKGSQVVAWPIDEYYASVTGAAQRQELEKHVRQMFETVTGKALSGEVIRREYPLEG